MEALPGIKSIENYISILGGSPRNSFGKTTEKL